MKIQGNQLKSCKISENPLEKNEIHESLGKLAKINEEAMKTNESNEIQ